MNAGRPAIQQLERMCQKPDHRTVGNWMARKISRPMALRVTWIILPWHVSAHGMTLLAWCLALAATVALGHGSVWGWLAGAALLQLWYLLDHVDGQLARFHGTASLDGVQLDYLMHHTVNLLVPLGIAYGLFTCSGKPLWLIVGLVWSVSLLLLGLQHDARYKAFTQRLKRVRGDLLLVGGGPLRPAVAPNWPSGISPKIGRLARKACEMHVVMNTLTLLALLQLVCGDWRLLTAHAYTAVMAVVSCVTAATTICRSVGSRAAEEEFAQWYRPPPGCDLVFDDGWWRVLSRPGADAEDL